MVAQAWREEGAQPSSHGVVSGVLTSLGVLTFTLAILSILPVRHHASDMSKPLFTYLREMQRGGVFELDEATRQVRDGTRHAQPRHVHFLENWMQWAAGFVYSPLRRTQDTHRLIAGGLAECSERSQILKGIAEAAGLPCRFVGLNGHVALEVFYQDRWHFADPEYGMVLPFSLRELEQPAQADYVRDSLAITVRNPWVTEHYMEILQSAEDNVVFPVGAAISPRLHRLEQLCAGLLWLLPSTCLALGWTLRLYRG